MKWEIKVVECLCWSGLTKSFKNCRELNNIGLKRKYSKVKLLPSCPELSRCSIRSQPNALSLPFFLDFCLIPLFFMWLQLVIQIIIANGSLGAQGSIHMSQKKKNNWDYSLTKLKENKKQGHRNPNTQLPNVCIRSHSDRAHWRWLRAEVTSQFLL